MVSLQNSLTLHGFNVTRPYHHRTPPPSSAKIARSMRTIRSNIFHPGAIPEPRFDSISPEELHLTVDALRLPLIELRRSAAATIRLMAKNRADNRAVIGESGAIPALIPLLRCSDQITQEHAVTALFNLSLHEKNKSKISTAVRSLIYALKTGAETSKQSAACALLSVAVSDEKKLLIGVSGAIPPLVDLLANGSSRGKNDALAALYKLCSVNLNKERAVAAGAAGILVELLPEKEMTEKATAVLSSLAGVEMGREAIVAENGIYALVEVIESGSNIGKEFAVSTLLEICSDRSYLGFLVGEGGIPPLVLLSHTGTGRAKRKAETLLRYMRESRNEGSSSS